MLFFIIPSSLSTGGWFLPLLVWFHVSCTMYCRYKNDPEILAMTNLIAAYQRNEILEFEKILKVKYWVLLGVVSTVIYQFHLKIFLICFRLTFYVSGCWVFNFQSNRRTIMDDPFIRNYIEDLLKNIRTQVLLKLIKPYTRIRIPFISKVILLTSLLPFNPFIIASGASPPSTNQRKHKKEL